MLNVTARLDLMSKILDTLKAVVEDAKFDFKENSLHIRVVDHSRCNDSDGHRLSSI